MGQREKDNELILWPLEKLQEWNRNPRRISKQNFEALRRKIDKFGVLRPLLVKEDGTVLGGNQRLRVFRARGDKEAWVKVVYPKSKAEELEIAILDNEQEAEWVEEDLAELISENYIDIKFPKDYKLGLGKEIDLEELLNKVGPSEEELGGADEEEGIVCPQCGFVIKNGNKG